MKHILHVSGTFKDDGSTYSTLQLHKYLNKNGYISSIAYLSPNNNGNIYHLNNSIKSKIKFFFLNKFNSLLIRIFKKDHNFAFFNNFIESGLEEIIDKINPDIIHFHWMPRTININKISILKKKLIWTIRDFWAFTGGCNVPVNCSKFKTQCFNCPHLVGNYKKDLSYYNFLNKKKLYKQIKDMTITFPCSDFKQLQQKSILKVFKKSKIIPNAIDDVKSKYIQKKTSKKFFTILFGAQNLDQTWKGTDIIIQLIKKMENQNIKFIIFGKTEKFLKQFADYKNVNYIGYIRSRKKLRKIFSNSDLFIFPSYYESFGKLIIESLSCGIPVIANNAFGAKDIISHKNDGFLVKNQNLNDYIKGIEFFKNSNKKIIEKNCTHKSQKYTIDLIGKKYSEIYEKL